MSDQQETGPASGWKWADDKTPSPQPQSNGPLPSELNRPDRHLIGFSSDPFTGLQQFIANRASKLPESLRGPVATYLSAHVEGLRALFDSVNTPEGAAAVIAPHAPDMVGPAGKVLSMAGRAPRAGLDAVTSSVNPDVVGIVSPRAANALRVAERINKALPAQSASATPSATMPAGYERFMPNTSAGAEAPPIVASAQAAPSNVLSIPKLTAAEYVQARKWEAAGLSRSAIIERIMKRAH